MCRVFLGLGWGQDWQRVAPSNNNNLVWIIVIIMQVNSCPLLSCEAYFCFAVPWKLTWLLWHFLGMSRPVGRVMISDWPLDLPRE